MAEELQEQKLTEPVQEAAAEPSAPDAQEAAAEQAEPEVQEAPKEKKNILLPLLTILLLLTGVGEAVFWGYFGLSTYRNSLARERYEQQQKLLAEQRESQGITGGSAFGPNLKVENGTVTWEREQWSYGGTVQAELSSTVPRRADGLRLSSLSVVRVPYTLAEMHPEETVLPQEPVPDVVDGETAPTST